MENNHGILVDIQSEEDFRKNHLPGAINVDLMSQNFVEILTEFDKDQSLLLYCTDGSRSKIALKILSDIGFENVYQLTEGITSWENIAL